MRGTPSILLLALVSLLPPIKAHSQPNCSPLDPDWPGEQSADVINLVYNGPGTFVAEAARQWNGVCDVGQVPQFQTGSSPIGGNTFNANVTFVAGSNPQSGDAGGCGEITTSGQGSTMHNADIVIYEQDRLGNPCDLEGTMAHELGHLLGLDNATDPDCSDSVMWRRGGGARVISLNDCLSADAQWFTTWESPDPCDTPQPPQGCDPYEQGPGSPIIVDLDRDQFHLAGLDHPVFFDIDDDGHQEALSWTAASTFDAFLYLDRNGNGRVDSGAELFGNYTPLIDGSRSANGYIPLAEFDLLAMGGDENGFVDAGDVIYNELQLWIDRNHNGISEPTELLSLADAGVTRIALRYRTSGRTDSHGNEFRYISRAWILVNGHELPTWTSDIFFVLE